MQHQFLFQFHTPQRIVSVFTEAFLQFDCFIYKVNRSGTIEAQQFIILSQLIAIGAAVSIITYDCLGSQLYTSSKYDLCKPAKYSFVSVHALHPIQQ